MQIETNRSNFSQGVQHGNACLKRISTVFANRSKLKQLGAIKLWIRRSVVRVHPAVPKESITYTNPTAFVGNVLDIMLEIPISRFVLSLPMRNPRSRNPT
jgi:hypothetical protein